MLLPQYNMGGSYLECTPLLNEFDPGVKLKKTNYFITDLLPQNNLALVRDSKMAFEILKTLYNIISLLMDCMHKFYVSKQYRHFDPHVGDTACQIRAYAFIVLSKKKDDNNVITERLHFFNVILDKLTKILRTEITCKNKRLTIIEFLKNYECYFPLTWEEYFLYKSYFLTLFKKSNSQITYICSNEIACFLKVSKKLSKKMAHKYQSHLAMMSCDFIKTIALDLNINKKNSPSIVFSISYDDDGRMVYPLFFSSRILFMHMQKTGCAVLVVLETINGNNSYKDFILFDKGDNQGRLLTKNNSSIKKEEVCMVIISTRFTASPLLSAELLKKLNYFGLYATFLMNAAAHKQFSGVTLAPFANQFVPDTTSLTGTEKAIETEFLALKSDAHQYGFCQGNPSILLIKHIFMDTVSNQVDLDNNTHNMSVREAVDIEY